jgi:hypothetical protein
MSELNQKVLDKEDLEACFTNDSDNNKNDNLPSGYAFSRRGAEPPDNSNDNNNLPSEGSSFSRREEEPPDNNNVNNNLFLLEMVKKEFFDNLKKFINELDIVFDYIDKSVINKLNSIIKSISKEEELKEFCKNTQKLLKPHENNFNHILFSNTKIKSNDYKFLSKICLFDDLLNFKIFNAENKNTKKTLVTYLNNILTSCSIINLINSQDKSKEMTQELIQFMKSIQQKTSNSGSSSSNSSSTIELRQRLRNNINNRSNSRTGNNSGNSSRGLDTVFSSLLENKELFNIANDISNDLKNKNINPMNLLTSLVTGQQNNQINDLMKDITNKIESKINNGDIDKEELENKATDLLNIVENSDIMSEIPLLKTMMNNKHFKK